MTPDLGQRCIQSMKPRAVSNKSTSEQSSRAHHESNFQSNRALSAASTFLSGIMAISASQLMGAPLKALDPQMYRAYMAWTKENFAILMTVITEWWAPTIIRVGGDESMKDQLYQMDDGTLKCNFPHRTILMANHQLYTDWLYLWWIAYTNKMHGHVYFVLKEALSQLPVVGWGMHFFNFILLSRKWEKDKHVLKQSLGRLRNTDPAWVIIFPEGTNLSAPTREKSAQWSKQAGIPDMKHQLLPRTTGLQFCLAEMQSSTNWLYDATIAYEGAPKGTFGQDVFTLKSSFLEGRPPKSVNIFWRRFRIADIPYNNTEAFTRWLVNRWREKDYMLEYFDRFGRFPAGDAFKALCKKPGTSKQQHAKAISTYLRGGGEEEFLKIFGPVTLANGALSAVDDMKSLDLEKLLQISSPSERTGTLTHGTTNKPEKRLRSAQVKVPEQEKGDTQPTRATVKRRPLNDSSPAIQSVLKNSQHQDRAFQNVDRSLATPAESLKLPLRSRKGRTCSLEVLSEISLASHPAKHALQAQDSAQRIRMGSGPANAMAMDTVQCQFTPSTSARGFKPSATCSQAVLSASHGTGANIAMKYATRPAGIGFEGTLRKRTSRIIIKRQPTKSI